MGFLNENGEYNENDEGEYIMPESFSEYYFAAQEEEDPWGGDGTETVVYFTPIEYFESNGYMFDGYMPMEDKLPRNLFSQAMEATYTFKGSVAEAKATCEALGFKPSARLTEVCEKDLEF